MILFVTNKYRRHLFHVSIVPKFVASPKLYQFQTTSCDSFASRVVAFDHTQIGIINGRVSTVDFFPKVILQGNITLLIYGRGFLDRMIITHILKSREIYESLYFIFQLSSWRRTRFHVLMLSSFFYFLIFPFTVERTDSSGRLSRDQVRNIFRI